ncbi:MAG: alpha/beta fold hydrolase [Mycobacterium sp.]
MDDTAVVSAFRSDRARVDYCRLYDAALAASVIPISESDVETSYGRTHVLDAGDPLKPPLVAFHGSSGSSTSWVPFLPLLAATHRVVMIDAIDEASKSAAIKPTTQISDIVAWLDETLRALDIRRSAIVGASRGAWMATHYACTFPERLDRLALWCPVGLAPGLRLRFGIRALTAMYARTTESKVESFLDSMVMPANRPLLRQEPYRLMMQQFVSGAVGFKKSLSDARPKPWPSHNDCDLSRLASAGTPVLAVIGRQESIYNGPKTATRLRQQLPEARIELIDDANHMVMIDQREVVEKLLADFLQ